jgi:regulator of replication initiation timing
MVDELTAAKGQMNKRDREIDDLDARVRKITEDRATLEANNEKLQRQLREVEAEKVIVERNKEKYEAGEHQAERRIYEATLRSQDLDR